MHDIEQLDALGREKGRVIYAIHQANAGWGCQWYLGINPPMDSSWREHLMVYNYYPTIAEMIEAETKRVNDWEAAVITVEKGLLT